LKVLSNLDGLRLQGTAVSDVGLAELTSLRRLWSLDLRDTQVTSNGLRQLFSMPALCFVELEGSPTGRQLSTAGTKADITNWPAHVAAVMAADEMSSMKASNDKK
jgi:hypothetical protein